MGSCPNKNGTAYGDSTPSATDRTLVSTLPAVRTVPSIVSAQTTSANYVQWVGITASDAKVPTPARFTVQAVYMPIGNTRPHEAGL